MQTIKFNKGNTKIIAHRGLSGIEIENTAAAFIAAGNRSYFGIESDVHITSDGKFVIIHDDTTGRIAAKNLIVEKSTLHQLRQLELPDNGRPFPHLVIPTLEEYILLCKKYEKTCVLELKNQFTGEQITQIIHLFQNTDYLNHVIFISFHLNNLLFIRKILVEARLQYLTTEFNEKIFNTLLQHRLDLDIEFSQVNPALVNRLHKVGIQINCWTCDKKEKAEALTAMGVDFITTNILE